MPSSEHPPSLGAGRYQVKRLLGEGGRKRVYLAHDTRLDRDVAIALIKTEGLDDAARTRLHREAQAMGRLGTQPHLVTVFDVGEEDGQPYLVSEFMAGGALDAVLRAAPDRRLPMADVLRLAMQICRGLEHAHAGGVLHRDVKPANVWLAADGTAKLGDFGLALALDDTRLTLEGMMVGTVAYMAPEQALGGPLDPRTDLYALGALLYEMVTGAPPFTGAGAAGVVSQHLHATPVPPSWHAPTLPPALDALILQLVAKTPAERPPSAKAVREVLEAIEPIAEVQPAPPIVPAAPSAPSQADRFVGRAREMDVLRARLQEAMGGQGRLVLLAGEPGIGKTRTAEELATYARSRGMSVLWGRCLEGEGAPAYWPWVQVIRAHARERDAAALRAELGSGADDVAQLVSEIRARLPDVQPPPALEPAEARFRLFDSVTTFLKNVAGRQPLLLVLDDLHWADTPSLLLLEFLAREIGSAHLLVLGTFRDVEIGPGHRLFDTLGELARVSHRLALRGFDVADLERYVQTTAGAAPSTELVTSLQRETNGNPFFVGEVVRLLVAEGGADRLRKRPGGALPVPEQVREVIGRRFGRLSAECQEVLRLAAIIGRSFDVNLLVRTSELPRERVLAALEEAGRIRLIAPVPDSLLAYRFAHALVRETLYEASPFARRALLHQRVGYAAEALFGTDASRHVALLAHHFFEAVRAGGDVREASAYSRRAGERADHLLAFEEAVRHYERALQLLDLSPDVCDDRERLVLLRALGAEYLKCDAPAERQIAVAERAVELAERIGDPALQANAALEYHLVIGQSLHAQVGVQIPVLERALSALGANDSVLAVRLLAALVREDRDTSRRRLRLAESARAMAGRLGDLEAQLAALSAIHAALLGPQWTDERVAIGIEEVQVAERLGLYAHGSWNAFPDRVYDLCEAGDIAELDALIDRALASIERTRNVWLRGYEPLWRGMRAAWEGRFEQAERHARDLWTFARRTRQPPFTFAAQTFFWELRRAQGRLAEIDDRVSAPPLPEDVRDSRFAAARFTVHQLEMNREQEGREYFDRLAAQGFRDIQMGWHFLPAITYAAIAAHRLQDRARAAILYDRLLPYAGRNVVFGYGVVCFGSASLPLGLLAATLERFDDAARHFEDAIAFDRKTGGRPAVARAQFAYAAMLHARGHREGAGLLESYLSDAQGRFEELGMKKDLERALALQLRVRNLETVDVESSIDLVATTVGQERPDLRAHAAPDGTVTILFTDIEGAAAMTARLGDRRAQAVLSAHNALVREQVAAHGGFEVKSQGDGFMVAFASARRAVLCAIAIQRALTGYHAQHPEEPIRVRIGLHAGETIREADDFFGTNVIVAARIAAAARGGQILASSVVKELVESAGDVPFGASRKVELRGLADARRLYTVHWAGESAAQEVKASAVFRREGDYWTIAHEGVVCRLKDTTGLRYLAHLLRHPGREFHALDLMRAVTGAEGTNGAEPVQAGAGPVLDARAKADYRRRLADLREELVEAEAFNDPGRTARVREEIEVLTEQLAAGVGLGGRDRVVGADAERARSAVTHGIKGALRRITQRVPSLGRPLAACIRTGTFCAYTPDATHPLRFEA